MGGRLMFPAFPNPKVLPWVLAAVSIASLVFGVLDDNVGAVVIGVGGLAFIALAYGVAPLVMGRPGPDESEPEADARDHL